MQITFECSMTSLKSTVHKRSKYLGRNQILFVCSSDGIPSYVSKEQLFSALTRIMKKPSIRPDKKVEAVDLSGKGFLTHMYR